MALAWSASWLGCAVAGLSGSVRCILALRTDVLLEWVGQWARDRGGDGYGHGYGS